jgi:hypothetical protein
MGIENAMYNYLKDNAGAAVTATKVVGVYSFLVSSKFWLQQIT